MSGNDDATEREKRMQRRDRDFAGATTGAGGIMIVVAVAFLAGFLLGGLFGAWVIGMAVAASRGEE